MHMVFLICVSAYLVVTPSRSQQSSDADNYGIILDGGSSGTKLKIYQWRREALAGGDVTSSDDVSSDGAPNYRISLEMIESRKFKPGVSALAQSLENVHGYVAEVLHRAMEVVPRKHHRQTRIYFLATAGLRTLTIEASERLLGTIEAVLRNQSVCPFLLPSDAVRVLSGEEEAVYAWVAANHLRGFFWSHAPPSQAVGVLEMGGGSTQIAFLPDHSIYANMFPVRVAGRTYHLYAHSYLFYGQNYIVSRINEYLVALRGDENDIKNPCMLSGDNTTVMSLGNSVHIQGSADVTKCLEIIDIFLRTADDAWCYPKPCAIGRTYQPSVQSIVFYAISAFIYAPRYLGAVDDMGRLNVSRLQTETAKYCKKTLSDVVRTGLSAEYASSYCTMGLYIPSLLMDAYGFQEGRNDIYVMQEIDSVNIDWALGAMLLEVDARGVPEVPCDISRAARQRHVLSSVLVTLLISLTCIRFSITNL